MKSIHLLLLQVLHGGLNPLRDLPVALSDANVVFGCSENLRRIDGELLLAGAAFEKRSRRYMGIPLIIAASVLLTALLPIVMPALWYCRWTKRHRNCKAPDITESGTTPALPFRGATIALLLVKPLSQSSIEKGTMQLRLFASVTAVGLLRATTANAADCVDSAAAHHGVNSVVLRAIGWHESKLQPQAIGKNGNGTYDLGAFQINTIHLPSLAKYGVDRQALLDGCVSAYVGAWLMKGHVARHGNTWEAIGAYHSNTPERRAWYANQIAGILQQWGAIPRGPLPYVGVPLLAPTAIPAQSRTQTRYATPFVSTTAFDGTELTAQ
jgi:hypothetical protein